MSDAAAGRGGALIRYPVKSMAGEPLRASEVSWNGLAGDRRWAFIRAGLERSDFPWLTSRERADLGGTVAAFISPDRRDMSDPVVATPEGDEYDVTDPTSGERRSGDGARVIKQNRGVFDMMPLSLIDTQTVSGDRTADRDASSRWNGSAPIWWWR